MDSDPVESMRIFRHLPTRPSLDDMERAFRMMRDRLFAAPYSPSTRRNWACGVHRRGWRTVADDQRQPPSTHR